MRNLKKVLSLSLALVMLIGMMVVGAGAAKFDDVPDGAEKAAAIEVMSAIEIIRGDAGSSDFRPTDTLTRAEAAVIISKVLFTPAVVERLVATETNFTDLIGEYEWAIPYVQACANNFPIPVIKGATDTTFEPGREVTGIEFAAMLMRVLDVDDSQFANWEFEVQKRAISMELDANGVTVSKDNLSREDAAQMAMNALMYSPSGESSYTVTLTNGKVYTFNNSADAYFFHASNAGSTVAMSTAKDSLGAKNFGLASAPGTDELGMPTTVWTATNPKVSVTVPAEANATVVVKGTLNADQTKTALKGYEIVTTAGSETKSVKDGGDPSNVANYAALKALTDDNTTAYVYADADKKITKVVIVTEKMTQVSSVTEAKDDKPATITVAGQKIEATGYEKGDYVLYNTGKNTDGDTVVLNVRRCDALVGTVTSYTGDKFTVNGSVYDLNKGLGGSARTIMANNMGKEITIWLDGEGKIVAAKAGNATMQADYLFVLGNSSAKETSSYMQGAAKVVEITALNTAGEVATYNVSKIGGSAVDSQEANEWKGKLFSYVDNNGLLEVTDESATSSGKDTAIAAKATSIVYDVSGNGTENNKTVALNSSTSFVFATFAAANGDTKTLSQVTTDPKTNAIAYKDVTVKIGNAEIGTGFNSENAYVVAKNGVAVAVFVVGSYADAAAATTDLVYYGAGPRDHSTTVSFVDGKQVTTHTYTVYNTAGEKLTMTGPADLAKGVYTYDTDNKIIAGDKASAKDKLIQTVSGDTVVLVDGTTYLNVSDAQITYLGDNFELLKGQTITYVLKPDSSTEVANLWVVGDQKLAEGEFKVAMVAGQADKFDVVVTDGEDIYAGAGVKNTVTVTITKKGEGTFNSMGYVIVTPKDPDGHATGNFSYQNTGTAWDTNTASVTFSFSLTGTGTKDVMPSLEFEVSATALCLHTHISSVAAKSNATCQEFNYSAHYKCDDCEQLFSDAAGTTPISEAPDKVAGAHDFAQGTDNSGAGGTDDSDKCVCQTAGCTVNHPIVDEKNNETQASSPDSKCDTCGRDISSDT